MNDLQSPQDTLQTIPGWEQASWSGLDGGLTNRSWLVEANGRKAVLKVDASPRPPPFNTRRAEARIQRAAAAQGLANSVLFVADTVYLTEFVDGVVWTGEDLHSDNNIRALAAALQSLHGLPLSGRVFDPLAAASSYLPDIGDADPIVAERCMDTVRSTQKPQHLCCCHNDLVAENILLAQTLRFLDWEYAADNDPFFDLATVVAHHGLSHRQADLLLDTYFDGDGSRWRERLTEQEQLYEALYWLWHQSRP